MAIDGGKIASALRLAAPLAVHRELCRSEAQAFLGALGGQGPVRVLCTQEAALFTEMAGEAGTGPERLVFTNIRERAGWTADKADLAPKIAALVAEARHAGRPAGTLTLKSEGQALVYGAGPIVLEAAASIGQRLAVTAMVTEPGDAVPPASGSVPIVKGRIRRLTGHLGRFEVTVDGYAPMLPSSRRGLEFAMARDGARSACELVIDLSGGPALMSEASRRDGYLRADPGNPAEVARVLLAATDLVGEFEKPLHVAYDASICAHARSGKVGCRNCLDACPMGAISPDGDTVAIDHHACAGCGACSALCPTGAVSHMLPGRGDLAARAGLMLAAYRRAGGEAPVVLLHEAEHGGGIISASSRLGRGLPAHVLPLEIGSVTAPGHEVLAQMLASGAARIVALVPPGKAAEQAALEREAGLVGHILAGLGFADAAARIAILREADPDAVEAHLWEAPRLASLTEGGTGLATGKREMARVALARLFEAAPAKPERLALPKGAPYGRIVLDQARCTLCLACVGACPAKAIGDHPERPEVTFLEAACVQCGVCVATCPESAITLEAGYDFTTRGLEPRVLKSEPPFACIECGKPFGARSSIERVVERLKGHAMFRNEDQLRLVQMCDTCRVVAVTTQGGDPMRVGQRPAVRTTDDYIEARETARRTGKTPDDFLDS
jgi:ferredoxin